MSSLVPVFGVEITPLSSLKNRPSTGTLLAGVLFLRRSFGAGLFVALFVLAWLWVVVSLRVMIDLRIWSVEWTKGSPSKRVLQRKDGFPMRYFEFSGLAYGLGLRLSVSYLVVHSFPSLLYGRFIVRELYEGKWIIVRFVVVEIGGMYIHSQV